MDKSALLALLAPKTITTDIDGIGPVALRELSAPEVSEIRESCKGGQENDFGFRLVAASLVDDAGAPLFGADDFPSLRAASQRSMGALVAKVMEINGFTLKGDAEKN